MIHILSLIFLCTPFMLNAMEIKTEIEQEYTIATQILSSKQVLYNQEVYHRVVNDELKLQGWQTEPQTSDYFLTAKIVSITLDKRFSEMLVKYSLRKGDRNDSTRLYSEQKLFKVGHNRTEDHSDTVVHDGQKIDLEISIKNTRKLLVVQPLEN